MAQGSTRRTGSGPIYTTVVAAIVVVCTLLVGFDGWRSWQARSTEIAEDQRETANLASSLAQHVHDTLEAADTVLVGIRQGIEADGTAPWKLDEVRAYMAVGIGSLPALHGLFVYDTAGHWIVDSTSAVPKPVSNSDRAYFQYHLSHPDRGVRLGLPIRSRSDGSWIVTVSRRLDAPDGSFGGVVLATLSVGAMQDFYARFDVGRHGAISLLSQEGFLVARSPPAGVAIGTDVSHGALHAAFELASADSESLQYRSSVDGVARLGSYHRVEGFPLVVVVGRGLEDALVGWQADAISHSCVVLGVVTILALLGQRFARQVRRGEQSEHRYRLLAEHSSDAIICVALTGERLYVSPAFSQMTGWSDEESGRQPWGHFVHPDDRRAIMDIGRQFVEGAAPRVAAYRILRRDGSQLWVEATFVLLPEARGEPAQFVASIRDIAARKLAEDRLTAANLALATLAGSDGLTGAANRRRLDEVLDQEWRRAARDLHPLSVFMIDVDCFKAYNDSHGHQKGDQVLRSVADTIAQAARRPGDLVARYGGEEFAVLLADTDAFGAAGLAERVRADIEALGIAHAGSVAAGCVTVSVGVATACPGQLGSAMSQEDLIAAADAALYGAKHGGRNRVVSAVGPEPVVAERFCLPDAARV